MIISKRIPARIGIMGNPSDGFFGKTIACLLHNFAATVSLWESPDLEIIPSSVHDPRKFASLGALATRADREGYYGGLRLLFATCRRFHRYCREHDIPLGPRNFTITYETDIPVQVGLAGSSAIIAGAFLALMEFYRLTDADIPKPIQPEIVRSVESDELELYAGLQDRVVQIYGGMVYMDFDRELMEAQGHGRYEPMDPALLPPLFVAFQDVPSASTKKHSDVRYRYEAGDRGVIAAMREFAGYAEQANAALEAGDHATVGDLMTRNFELRRAIYGDDALGQSNLEMIDIARAHGLPAKFPGSGGAVIGICGDETLARLQAAYAERGYECLRALTGPRADDA